MADRFFDPERWRYADEERAREETRRPRYGERDTGERQFERSVDDREYWRNRAPCRDERGMLDRATDEVRSWFGDEDAQRRRLMDEREDRWQDPTRRRDRAGDVSRQWGYVDRSEWTGPDWRAQNADHFGERHTSASRGQGHYGQDVTGTQGTSWYGRPDALGGPHAGRGPRGWQRSDERIKEDVCERMTQHPALDASDLEVRVANCEITLTGSVSDREAKRLAEDIAESVSGVKDVHNQIRVTSGSQDSQPPSQRGFGGERRIA